MRDKRLIQTLAIASLPLIGYWVYGLFDLDEGYYAAVVREMIQRGDWITPTVQGVPWFEKPILLYWLAKPCVMLFGDWVGPRLPSVIGSLVAVYGVYRFAERHYGRASAQLAGLALAAIPLWAVLGRMMMTDTLLATCLGMALLTSYDALEKPKDFWKSGIWLGFAVLAKGPVSLVLFFGTWIMSLGVEGVRKKLHPLHVLSVPVALLVASAWYVPAYQANGQLFIQKFFIEQNFGRFAGGDQAHTVTGIGGYLFYIPVLLVAFAPWTWQPRKLWPGKDADPLSLFLVIAFLIPFLFFSVTAAKLPHYILPCAIPLALLVARRKKGLEDQGWSDHLGGVIALVAIASLVTVVLPMYYHLGGQAELHRVAGHARDINLPLVVDLKPGGLDPRMGFVGVRETSHPSLVFVTGKTFVSPPFTVTEEGVRQENGNSVAFPITLLTRAEVSVEAIRGLTKRNVELVSRSELYALYRVE